LAQIGFAEQALGRWVDAEVHLTQALSDVTQAWIRKNGSVLRKALEEIQRHIGSMEVMGPPGAEVRVNGQVVGMLPFEKPVRLPIGTLNVELRKEGFLPTTRPVSIGPGLLTRENIDLPAAPSAPIQPVEAARTSEVDMKTATRAPTEERGTEREERPAPARSEDVGGGWSRPLAWGAAVVAVLGAAGGATALLLRNQKLKDIDGLQCTLKGGTVNPPDPNNTGRCLDLANSSSTFGVAAVVGFSIAGALAITSGVLFATAPSRGTASASAPPTTRLACAPLLPTPGAVCRLQF
jgi:hypothetical protein